MRDADAPQLGCQAQATARKEVSQMANFGQIAPASATFSKDTTSRDGRRRKKRRRRRRRRRRTT